MYFAGFVAGRNFGKNIIPSSELVPKINGTSLNSKLAIISRGSLVKIGFDSTLKLSITGKNGLGK